VRFLLRRVGHGLLLLFAVSLLSFLLAELAPGDFLAEMRFDPQISSDTVETLRERYGLDRPLPVRYLSWLASIGRGELGYSFSHRAPVAPLLRRRAGNTLLLTVSAMLLAWAIAVPLGAWMARRPGGWADRLGLWTTALPLAVPDLLLALAGLWLAARTGWFPVGGMTSLDFDQLDRWGRLVDLAHHLALPVAVLSVAALPVLVRHVRSALLESLQAPFVSAARGHGIPRRRLLFRYALPAAANPLISLFGLSVARLLSGSLLVEVVLGWPGMGPLFLEAILARDLHVVVAATLCSCLFLIAGNLAADLLLYAADPRIRRREEGR
jgi:peptide/nickel transport system permease protein